MADKQTLGRAIQRYDFVLQRGITDEGIDAILKKLYIAAGCRPCGLVGFDVRFHVIDPQNLAQFQGIENLADVSTPSIGRM